MTTPTTRRGARPDLASVLRGQLSLIAASRKVGTWIAFGYVVSQTVALATAGVIFGISIDVGGSGATVSLGTRIADLEDVPGTLDAATAGLLFAVATLLLWGLFWPFKVWRGERPSNRDHHRAMPVEQPVHDLIRVAAGGIWLLLIEVTVIGAAVVSAGLAGHATALAGLSPAVWLQLFAAPPILYLAASAVLIRAEHPAAWIWGVLGALALLPTLASALRLQPVVEVVGAVFVGRLGLLSVLAGPLWYEAVGRGGTPASVWPLGWALWFVLALAGLLFAAGMRIRRPLRRRAAFERTTDTRDEG